MVSGGANRGQIFRFPAEGGSAGQLVAALDEPVFNMAFDGEGWLWATTGGGALLQLDADSGRIAGRHGDGLTMGLAIHPETGQIFVGSHGGVEIFDPATGSFTRFSRDLNLRFASLAFDHRGLLWAVTWPDRRQLVRFTEQGRAERVLEFASDIDSLAFGQPDTPLAGLLLVSHNHRPGRDGGNQAVDPDSELTAVDIATLRHTVIARGGTRGDTLLTTRDGRILLSQSNQVDVITPAIPPKVLGTAPSDWRYHSAAPSLRGGALRPRHAHRLAAGRRQCPRPDELPACR